MRATLLSFAVLAVGCRGAPAAPTSGAGGAAVVNPAPPTPAEAVGPALPEVHAVLESPRLADALARELARDHKGAAQALERAHAAIPPPGLPAEEECAWQYARGRLYLAGGDAPSAATAFDAVLRPATATSPACSLADYAGLRAASAYARSGDYPAAIARARAIPDAFTRADEARLVLANAMADGGDVRGAVPIWRALLVKNPKAWVDVACRLSAALLDGADGPPEPHAAEALDLATRVIVEAPKIEATSGALALRARALALLPSKRGRAEAGLTPAQRDRRAKALLDGGESRKALTEADALLGLGKAVPPAIACNASVTRAQATARARLPNVAEAWTSAIERCAQDDAAVSALYQGAKAVLAKDPALAAARFAEVERRFPHHRLADDARFQGALVALGQGDEARFLAMMTAIPADYPEGDMRGEALFRVALLLMTKGDWAAAAPVLDRILALLPGDRHWATAGRAAYFRARAAAALGQRDDAAQRYARVVEEQPLTFYMMQAYDRLAAGDPGLARQTLDAASAREPSGPLLSRPYAELESPSFRLGLRLLEAGDIDAAKAEIEASGAVREEAESDLLWAVALLYDTGGAPEVGHAFARSRLTDYLAHYPSGRWKTPWEVAYPRAFSSLVLPESRAHAMPAGLTWAIMREESDFYADAKSASNAYGLMQLLPSTARGLLGGTGFGADEADLKRPDASIALGTKFLGGLRAQYADNRPLAIAAYNAGAGSVGRWLSARGDQDFDLWVEQIPFDETRGYEKRVLASEAAYGFLYDRAAFDEVATIPRRASGGPRGADGGARE